VPLHGRAARWTDAQRAHLSVVAPHPFEPIDYFVRAALALLAFEAGGLLFHAAGLAWRGNGYAFFGNSGSGKTTVARVSSHAQILNDDLVVLLPDAVRWNIHATPFSNPTQVTPAGPQFVPLCALSSGTRSAGLWNRLNRQQPSQK
jgi:hypothetical protein